MLWRTLLIAAHLIVALPTLAQQSPNPPQNEEAGNAVSVARARDPSGYLLAESGILTAQDFKMVSARLVAFNKGKNRWAGVVLVKSTSSDSINEYSVALGNGWNTSPIKPNILIVIATTDRRVHIALDGLIRSDISDEQASKVIDDLMKPELVKEDYANGVIAALNGLDFILIAVEARVEEAKKLALVAESERRGTQAAKQAADAAESKRIADQAAAAATAEVARLQTLEEARNKENIIKIAKMAMVAILVGTLIVVGWFKRKSVINKFAAAFKHSNSGIQKPTNRAWSTTGRLRLLGGVGCSIAALAWFGVSGIAGKVELTEVLVCGVKFAPDANYPWYQRIELRNDGNSVMHKSDQPNDFFPSTWKSDADGYHLTDISNQKIDYKSVKLISGDVASGTAVFSMRVHLNGKESKWLAEGDGTAPFICRGSGQLAKIQTAAPVELARTDPSKACRSRVTEQFTNSSMNPMAMAQALAECDSPQGQRSAQQAQSKEEKARAIIERVRVGGPYCDGIASYLERYLDMGRWNDYYETLGKAQQRGCI